MADAPQGETRMCAGCGRQIPVEYNVCPHCGRPQNLLFGPQLSQQAEPLGRGMAILLCVLSLFVPLFGIVIGVIWMGAEVDAERRRIGKTCLLLGILCVVLWVVIAALGLSWHMY